eukprot:scaffold47882_cov61-Cyclotella_meneghiniana.AAC.3
MDCLHIGSPPSDLWQTKTIYVNNFEELSEEKSNGNVVSSPTFHCFGHEWRVDVYPGGDADASNGCASIYLRHCSATSVTFNYEMICVKNNTEYHAYIDHGNVTLSSEGKRRVGDSLSRSLLCGLNGDREHKYLESGSLVIQIRLKLSDESDSNMIVAEPCPYNNMDIFLDDETSDVAFDVKGQIIVAHKCIIKAQAKDLYVLCEASSKSNPMLVNDIEHEVFEMMLRPLYGGCISVDELKKHSGSILKAAGKYGFNRLKSEAELCYAKSLKFSVENVIDEFLSADGNDWRVVREKAKQFMAEHGEEILESPSFVRLHESLPLMKEVMCAAFKSKKRKRSANMLNGSLPM